MIGLVAGRYPNQQILLPLIVICDWPQRILIRASLISFFLKLLLTKIIFCSLGDLWKCIFKITRQVPYVNFSSFVANFLFFLLNCQHFIKHKTKKTKTLQHDTDITLFISISLRNPYLLTTDFLEGFPKEITRIHWVEKSLGRKAGINVRIIHPSFCFC